MEEPRPWQVLMIDDDENLCMLIKDYLDSFGMEITFCCNGQKGLVLALDKPFDAVLLDIMLPNIDGLSILRKLRATKPDLPVVIISAQTDVSDRIIGLEMGADDYVPKTFAPRELLARLRAVLRRSKTLPDAGEGPLSAHGVTLDSSRMEVSLNGVLLQLGSVEFKLLSVLMTSPGRVFSREQLLDAVSGRDYGGLDRSIDMHISSLRRKLGDSPRSPSFVRTVRGSGYMFMR